MNPTLPPLHRAALDATTAEALFDDLAALTTIEVVRIKGAVGACTLAEARDALEAGARGVQVRYRWGGESWLDTILRTPAGLRIVRTHPSDTELQP
jgi:hypothetical protein